MNKWIQNSLIAACTMTCFSLMANDTTQKQQQQQQQQQQEDQNYPNNGMMGIYIGGFGGWVFPYDVTVSQKGTAFYTEPSGGPLAVNATGSARGKTKGFGGGHIGYEWMHRINSCFRLAPAFEFEGMYFANTAKKATLTNPTARVPEHTFVDRLPTQIGTLVANGILEFNNDYISPFIGIGIGAGFISVNHANSTQVNPAEAGVNHFNTDPSDFSTVFATQAKAGLRYRFLKHYRLSAEYRFIYLTPASFIFGSTSYASHVETSPWLVKLGGMGYNAFTLGFDFIF